MHYTLAPPQVLARIITFPPRYHPETMPLPPEGFLFEYAPGRLLIGEGPLDARAARDPDQLACYAPDFLLHDDSPWLHPTTWREVTREELRQTLGPTRAPGVRWVEPDLTAYSAAFRDVMLRIERHALTKAVPIVLERGRWTAAGGTRVPSLLRALLDGPETSSIYGIWKPHAGMIGASPELLFQRRDPTRVETVAMAGTYPADRAAALPDDPKERAEHQSVVEDIVAALTPLGLITVGPREVACLPAMAHLKTDITVELSAPTDFETLVAVLHPTAALGVWPRAAGRELLPRLGPAARGRFGAPFGVEWPDGRATVVVAIRNVQWSGADVLLGAGAGLIAQSELGREWEELRLKRDAVKGMLGL
jgi:isochorismate synthase EntC